MFIVVLLIDLVAAVASHLKGESWERFLNEKFIDEPSVPRVLRKFALAMTNVDQLGTLARPAEELKEIIQRADLDGDQKLGFDDFYNVMTKKTFA